MGFDPKAFLDEPDTTPTAPAFDPQAFLADEPPPPEPAYQPKPGDIPINMPKPIEPGPYGEDIARFEQQKAQNPDILKQKQDFTKPIMAGALNTAGFAAEMITKIPKWWKGFEDKGYDDQLKRLDEWEKKGANPEFIISQRERIQKERGNLQAIGDKAVKPVVKAVEPLTQAVKKKTLEWSETISPIADEAAALREELSDIGAGKDKFIDDMVDSYKKGTLDTKLNWFGTQALLRGDKKSAELSKQLAEEYRQAQLEDWQKQQQDPNFVGPVKPVSPGKFREITRSVARMAPGLVTSMAVSAVPIVGAPAAFAGWASQGAGQVYQDAVAQGADPEKARVSAAIAGPIYAAVEQIQIGQVAKNPVIKSKILHFLKEYGIDVAKEVNEEGLQGVVTTIATEKAKGNEDVNDIAKKAWESYLENAKSSIASLAVVTGATRGAHAAVGAMAGKPPTAPSKPGVDITVGGQNAEGNGESANQVSQQEGLNGEAPGSIHLRNNAGTNLLETGKEILKGISEDEQGAILRKVQGEKQAKEGMQNIVANMTTEEAQQIIAKAKLPNVDATKADSDVLARVKESADKILSEKKPTGEGSIYNMVQPAPADQEAGKTIAERHGLNFVDATEGPRDQGGVVLNFKDEISGKTISAPAGTAESEIAKTLADTRRENPEEYGKNIAAKAGVEYVGKREDLTRATGRGTYESEMNATFKTPLGNQITVPFSSTVEQIKTRAEEMDKQAGAPNVPEKVQAPKEVKPDEPVPSITPKVTRDTDRMLKMYVDGGKTETSLAKDTHANLLNVLNQVHPRDVADATGLTEEQAVQGIHDIQGLKNTDQAKAIRNMLAPSLFYGESVDEQVSALAQPRDASGELLFTPEAQPGIPAPKAVKTVEEIADRQAHIENLIADVKDEEKRTILKTGLVAQNYLGRFGVTTKNDMRHAARELDKAGIPYSIVVADIMNQKGVNDKYTSHDEADKNALIPVYGDIWQKRVRELGGIPFVTGGDEMGEIWPNKSPEEATKLRDQIEAEIVKKRDELGFTETVNPRTGLPSGSMSTDYGAVQGTSGKFDESFNEADAISGANKEKKVSEIAAKKGYTYNRETQKYERTSQRETLRNATGTIPGGEGTVLPNRSAANTEKPPEQPKPTAAKPEVAPKPVLDTKGFKVDDRVTFKGQSATIYGFEKSNFPDQVLARISFDGGGKKPFSVVQINQLRKVNPVVPPMKETAITPTKAGLVGTEKKADVPREQTVPPEQPKVVPAASPESNIVKTFENKYDPRALTKEVNDYLKANVTEENNMGSSEEGVGYYKGAIVFKLKSGDLVYLDIINDTKENLVKISANDKDFETIQQSMEKRKGWTPGSGAGVGIPRQAPKELTKDEKIRAAYEAKVKKIEEAEKNRDKNLKDAEKYFKELGDSFLKQDPNTLYSIGTRQMEAAFNGVSALVKAGYYDFKSMMLKLAEIAKPYLQIRAFRRMVEAAYDSYAENDTDVKPRGDSTVDSVLGIVEEATAEKPAKKAPGYDIAKDETGIDKDLAVNKFNVGDKDMIAHEEGGIPFRGTITDRKPLENGYYQYEITDKNGVKKEFGANLVSKYNAEDEAKLQARFGRKPEPAQIDLFNQPQEPNKPEETAKKPEETPKKTGETPKARLINALTERLKQDAPIKNTRDLLDFADKAYGGTLAEGKYGIRDAYDALEAAFNRHLEETGITNDIKATIQFYNMEMRKLPTQTVRTEGQVELQQFSTPPSEAYLVTVLGGIRKGTKVLEPSAGDGSIAVQARMQGGTVAVNEIDPGRRENLTILGFTPYDVDAEYLHSTLPDNVQPDVVVMNPPFSSTGGRLKGHNTGFGAEHVYQALLRLKPGGRLVAIVGNGMAFGKPKMAGWWAKVMKDYNVRANVGISGKEYVKYGTGFDNNILVIDKTGPTERQNGSPVNVITGEGLTVEQAYDRLKPLTEEDVHANIERANAGKSPAMAPKTDGKPGTSKPTIGNDNDNAIGRAGRPTPAKRPGAGRAPVPGMDKPGGSVPGTIGGGGLSAPNGTGQTVTVTNGKPTAGIGQENAPGPGQPRSELQRTESVKPIQEESGGVYAKYQVSKAKYKGSKEHPAKVSESVAMASVQPPDVTYKLHLPQSLIESGSVSDVQLEAITYACQAHEQRLPTGQRKEFLLGDGTGMGKARTIIGIIQENWLQGRKKIVYVTKSADLVNQLKADMEAMGVKIPVIEQGKSKQDEKIETPAGILFTTYSTAAGEFKTSKKRYKQILEWFGKDNDGVFIFDESHLMKNVSESKFEFGGEAKDLQEGADRGQMGVSFKKELPNARFVNASATAATTPINLAYLSRLGLWGPGTPFADFMAFLNVMKDGGTGAMELLSRDLKSNGLYLSRSISFDGVEYETVTHNLGEAETKTYNDMADFWAMMLQKIDEAAANAHMKGEKQKIMKQFYSAQQRFFLQLMMSFQADSMVKDADAQLEDGHSVVISLYNTNESQTNKKINEAIANGDDLDAIEFSPKDSMKTMLENNFPLIQYEEFTDENGTKGTRQVVDKNGEPLINKQNLDAQQALIEKIADLRIPENPIDKLVNHFGVDNIAEITGRKNRLIINASGHREYKARGSKDIPQKKINQHERESFMNGKKRVAIISGAAATGFDLHASLKGKNQQRRAFYAMQLSWSADEQMQAFGRVHRTMQKSEPIIKLMKTNIASQMRLVNTIQSRLASLGAMTKGGREALSGGIFTTEDITDQYGQAALRTVYQDLNQATLKRMNILDKEGGIKQSAMGNVDGFLNRIMVLPIEEQNRVFDTFYKEYQSNVEDAKNNNRYDEGIKKIVGENVRITNDEVLNKDESSGVETKLVTIEAESPVRKQTYAERMEMSKDFFPVVNDQSQRGYLARKSFDGRFELYGPRGFHGVADYGEFQQKYTKEDEKVVQKSWKEVYDKIPEKETRKTVLVTGSIFPVYGKVFLASDKTSKKVKRAVLENGDSVIGIEVNPNSVPKIKQNFGIGSDLYNAKGKQILDLINAESIIELDNGWTISKRKVMGEQRIEVDVGKSLPTPLELTGSGMFSEIIQYNRRYFIPTDQTKAEAALESIIKFHKAVRDRSAGPAMSKGRAPGSMTLDALTEKVQGELPRVMRMLPKDFKGKVNVSISKEFIYKGRKFGGDDWEAAVWYDPKGKVVEVHINPNISEKRLAMALMHELPGHIGSRLVYADNMPVYNRMKAFFDKMNAENHPSVTKIKDLYEVELQNDVNNEKLFDEWTAAQLSEYIENGKRDSITTRIYNFFRELLTKLGVVSKNLNDTMLEMINLMRKGTYETLGGNKPFQRFLYDTSGQRVEDTLTQEGKEENIRRARATASDYGKKPRTLTKKARKELKEAGYYVPEIDQEPIIFNFGTPLQKWFEGSKVVDKDGNPLPMYHGTTEAGFTVFEKPEHDGIYFTTDPLYAESYMDKGADNPPAGMYKVFISAKNPKYYDGENEESKDEFVDRKIDIEKLKRDGYDSAILRFANGDMDVMVLSPNQIKSAIGNSGEYSAENPDIRFSKVPKTVAEENAIRQAELDKMRGYSVYDRRGKTKRITEQDLPGIYEEAKTFNPDKARKAISKKYEVKQTGVNLAKYLGRTLSGRFLQISPIVRDKLQKHINKIHIDTANSMRRVLPLLEAVKKLPEADYRVFDIASKNSDVAEMDSIAEKYGFLEALEGYREVMNDMIVRAKAAGYETGYLENYFPRIPRDRNQYYKFIRKTPEWGQIDEALKQKAIDVGRPLEPVEEDEFINQYLRGYAGKNILGKPGNLKERKMKFIDNEMNSLLEDTILAIPMYLERMNKKIARKELFGNVNTSDDMIVDNLDESIGEYVGNLIRDYKLNPEKQDELIGLLKSYFNFKPTDRGLAAIKNLSYATSMGSGFSSMFSQMQDMTFSFVTAPGNTAGAVLKALQGKTDITVKDLGIQDLGAEFRDPGKLFAAVDKLLSIVGLKWGDVTFKNAFIQANLKKFQTMARTGKYSQQFKTDVANIFDEKADEVISDLKNGRNTDLVKLLVMNEMSKYQPITQFQVPQGYLDMPRGRIAYALKTYQINQVNAIIDEGIRAMQNAKDGDEWKAAFLRVISIMAVLMIAGMGMDALKDLLFRRKATMSEYAWDNFLKLFAISRYTTWQARTKGLYPTLLSLVAPPLNWIEYAWRDIGKATKNPEDFKLKNLESLRMLPIIGQEYHWWFGGGAEQTRKRAEKNLPPVKFEREMRKLKSEARRAARRGDDFEAAKKEQQIKELAEKSKPIIEEYFKKETSKQYPKKFQMMLEFENSKVQKLRYKGEEMFKSLNIGEKALYSKFKNESREKR